jgi:hypothetical protein
VTGETASVARNEFEMLCGQTFGCGYIILVVEFVVAGFGEPSPVKLKSDINTCQAKRSDCFSIASHPIRLLESV